MRWILDRTRASNCLRAYLAVQDLLLENNRETGIKLSFYLQLRGIQTPFSIGMDKNQREMYSCNYEGERYGGNSLVEHDLATLISAASILPYNILATNLLQGVHQITLGMRASLPVPTSVSTSADGPWGRIISTGGTQSNISRSGGRAERPGIQIIVASIDTQLAATKAWAIYRLLDGKRHITTT